MEIIDELEKEKRGLYAGCVGYFSAAGEMDTCIVLRTALVKDGKMYVQAGAGIVADSDPDIRAAGMRQQGEGAVPRRRGSAALRQRGEARAVTASLAASMHAEQIRLITIITIHMNTTACGVDPGNSLDATTAQTPGMDRKPRSISPRRAQNHMGRHRSRSDAECQDRAHHHGALESVHLYRERGNAPCAGAISCEYLRRGRASRRLCIYVSPFVRT